MTQESKGMGIVLTGASQGIGRSTSKLLAASGARIALVARNGERLEALVAEIQEAGGTAFALPCDVGDRQQVRAAMVQAKAHLGAIDVLINNAATGSWATVLEIDEEDWEQQYRVNVNGPLYCIRSVLPGMISRRRGLIVNVGSFLEHQPRPRSAAYCTTKAALAMLSDCLRLEVASYGIRVCHLTLGLVSTEFGGVSAEQKLRAGALTPEHVGHAIVHLISVPEGTSITRLQVEPTVPPETTWAT